MFAGAGASRARWVHLAKGLGLVLALASVGYVAWTLYTSGLLASDAWREPMLWLRVSAGGFIYGLALCATGVAWARLLGSVTSVHLGMGDAVRLYAVTQLYKYLPSNVMHYAARQVTLKQRGVEHAATAWAALAEVALLVPGALLVTALFGYAYFAPMLSPEAEVRLIWFGAALGCVGLVALAAMRWAHRLPPALARFFTPQVRHAAFEALALHAGFFLLGGAVLAFLAANFPSSPPLAALIAVAAGSWVVGFITPGASAGIGVREAVMIAALSQAGMDAGEAALLAVAYRVATTLGDVAFAAGAQLLFGRAAPAS